MKMFYVIFLKALVFRTLLIEISLRPRNRYHADEIGGSFA